MPITDGKLKFTQNATALETLINSISNHSAEFESVKNEAQARADNIVAKTAIRTFVNDLNAGNKIDFEGVYTILT